MNIVPKAGLTMYINDSGHKKVSFVRINRMSILSGLISVKIYELFRREKRNCLLYLVIWLHTSVSRTGSHCIFVQRCAILGFISFGLQCVFVNFS